jgi:hypothetical protein
MPTLRFRRFDEIPSEDQEHVTFLRARMRGREDINGIFGAQAHWPAYSAAVGGSVSASFPARWTGHRSATDDPGSFEPWFGGQRVINNFNALSPT